MATIADRIKSLHSAYVTHNIVPPTEKQRDLIQKLGGDPSRSTTSIEALKHFYSFVRWLIINTLKNKLKIVVKIFGRLKQKYYL